LLKCIQDVILKIGQKSQWRKINKWEKMPERHQHRGADIRNKNNGINKNGNTYGDVIGEKPAGRSGWAVTAYKKVEKKCTQNPIGGGTTTPREPMPKRR
jgi:hypothetical protein